MDRIKIRGLALYAFHGNEPFEKSEGQRFEMDIDLGVDMGVVGVTDNVDDTVDYTGVIKLVRAEFTARVRNTIECCARDITRAILLRYPSVSEVTVCLRKPSAPVNAEFESVGVEITEKRRGRR